MRCNLTHSVGDPIVGQPLCGQCYDYVGHVLFTWHLPELWRRFTIALRRAVATHLKTVGVKPGSVRISFGSTYNVSPRVSPDGRTLAFVTRREGRFYVALKDLASGSEQLLSDGGTEEAPSFAPNGRWIMYATRHGGRDSLMAVSIDRRVKQRLTSGAGDIREPTWGPLPN